MPRLVLSSPIQQVAWASVICCCLVASEDALRGTVKNFDLTKHANATVTILIPPYKNVQEDTRYEPLKPASIPAANATIAMITGPEQQRDSSGNTMGVTEVERWLIHYTNELRAQNGKPPQCGNFKLLQAARISAKKQAECRAMGHTTCDGATPADRIKQVGFNWVGRAENVAMNSNCGATPQKCAKTFVDQWYGSKEHKTNMMSINPMVGMSVANAASGASYATQVFGSSRVEACDFLVH